MGIGDTINGNTIDYIRQNEIQVNTGEKYESPTLQFLNFSTSRRSSKRSSSSSSRSKTNTNETTKEKKEQTKATRTERRSGRTNRINWESQIKRFQNASPGDQQKMIEQFRNRRRRNNG